MNDPDLHNECIILVIVDGSGSGRKTEPHLVTDRGVSIATCIDVMLSGCAFPMRERLENVDSALDVGWDMDILQRHRQPEIDTEIGT